MVICLERVADLHMAQLMPLPFTVFCFSKIQIGFTFLVPAYPGSPGKRAVKWVRVCIFQTQEDRFVTSLYKMSNMSVRRFNSEHQKIYHPE